MFLDEIKNLSAMKHPCAVGINSYSQSAHYIETEYVSGKTVNEVFSAVRDRGESVPVYISLYILHEVLRGLEHAHSIKVAGGKRIIHGDISPSNIVISYDGSVKICNFGIAKKSEIMQTTVAGALRGRLAYMSPEQTDASIFPDHRTDIFSTGIVLWELLAGRKLFTVEEDRKIISIVRSCEIRGPSSLNADIPSDLDSICMKALQRSRDDRYKSTGDFRKKISNYLRDNFTYSNFDLRERTAGWIKKYFNKTIEKEKVLLENMLERVVERFQSGEGISIESERPSFYREEMDLPDFEIQDERINKIDRMRARGKEGRRKTLFSYYNTISGVLIVILLLILLGLILLKLSV